MYRSIAMFVIVKIWEIDWYRFYRYESVSGYPYQLIISLLDADGLSDANKGSGRWEFWNSEECLILKLMRFSVRRAGGDWINRVDSPRSVSPKWLMIVTVCRQGRGDESVVVGAVGSPWKHEAGINLWILKICLSVDRTRWWGYSYLWGLDYAHNIFNKPLGRHKVSKEDDP